MKVEIILYKPEYYRQVMDLELKEDDKKEVEASNGLPFRRTVQKTCNMHKETMYLILYEGTVSGIFGVVPSGKPGVGIGYLLTDDRLKEYRWDMARYSLDVFVHLLKRWKVITNYVSSEHKVSLLWLKRLGARFVRRPDGRPSLYILHDPEVPFYKFELRKEDYV